jgi:polysaccharide pyruvyl transferase WcaK-like protein
MNASGPAIILWADDKSTNLGVRVLAEGNRRLVEDARAGLSADFQSYGAGPSPKPIGLKSLLIAWLRLDPSLPRWLSTYSVAVDTGAGDSFTDIYGLRRLVEMSLLRRLVARAGVPLVLGPQTIGPFNSRVGRLLARWSTRPAQLILARDSFSFSEAKTLALPHVRPATDAVFALPQPPRGGPAADLPPRTLLNVSGLLWTENSHVDNVTYRGSVIQLALDLNARGHRVALFAHVLESTNRDDDVGAIVAAREELVRRGLTLETVIPSNLADARATIKASRLVVAARMHACLNALSVGVPAIALAYSRKFRPLMEDLDWSAIVELDQSASGVVQAVLQISHDLETDPTRTETVVEAATRRLDATARELERILGQ